MVDTAEHWAATVAGLYGADATLEPLDGEYDLNFRVYSAGEPFAVFKVMRAGCDEALVDLQCKALEHVSKHLPGAPIPAVVRTKTGASFATAQDEKGEPRLVWMLSHLKGVPYGDFRPQTESLIADLGRRIGEMDTALASFDHPALDRPIKWNLTGANWIEPHIASIINETRRHLIEAIQARFTDDLKPRLSGLEPVAIHNDVNDYNILVDCGISGLVDFGDMIRAPRVCEVAIVGAYVVLDREKPVQALAALVSGYHMANPLSGEEIALIYPLALTRLAVSVVNAAIMKAERPGDPYVTISEAPAWRFLENSADIEAKEVEARLRVACGLPVTDSAERTLAWLNENRGRFEPVLGNDLNGVPIVSLSVEGSTLPRNPLRLEPDEARRLVDEAGIREGRIGPYAEPRLIYTGDAFRNGRHEASDRRTVHLGVDLYAPAGTPVQAPVDGIVRTAANAPALFDYGGCVVLEHITPGGDPFFTLYGHLNPDAAAKLKPGDIVPAGTPFATLGTADENGGWPPHLHFQLCVMPDGQGEVWPGVADPDDLDFILLANPNPAALLNLPDDTARYQPLPVAEIAAARRDRFVANLKLSYDKPCLFLRGWRHYLYDETGRCYLDAYNNVPHVGHAHPRIQALAAGQLARLNTNTRYLHPAQIEFADALLEKLPDRFTTCFFVNSGSEGNELALRLARAFTGGKDMIAPDHGYHGMTTGAIDISAYKFNKPGGVGQPDWVQLVSVPDPYRGEIREGAATFEESLGTEIDEAIDRIAARGGRLAGFIAETFPSVGGQIVPPKNYLKSVYEKVRKAGGVCIADEVQTGLGRLGTHYWAFDIQGVEPDIVVLGKPLGNGHPVGAVIATREIADAFANGIEFFSTFGGSTLSCMIGREVLKIVDDEGLQKNARIVGTRLMDGFKQLLAAHPVVGDVRGHGLFLGIDLVRSRETREPAGDIADYVVNRLRDHRVLAGTEGPGENVLKIRPPLTIAMDDAEMILDRLDKILNETCCQI